MNQYLDAQTVKLFSNTDDFMPPIFVQDKVDASGEPHEGWVNSATWCFDIHFMQEPNLVDAMRELIRKDGQINLVRAQRLFVQSGIPITSDCVGNVWIAEIVDHFLTK